MLYALKKYKSVVSLAVPSLLAILIAGIVNVQVYSTWPIDSGRNNMLFTWMLLQVIPGFLFAYLSDMYFRKLTLLLCQCIGLIGGVVLSAFGFEPWVLMLIALSFNPIPVARAALLDHFPRHSTVILVAITFLAQYIPWMFYGKITSFPNQSIVNLVLCLLAVNILLTFFLFKKDTNISQSIQPVKIFYQFKKIGRDSSLLRMFLAFIFAETAFFIVWAYFEGNPSGETWFSTSNLGTIIGICIAMLYTRVPHVSIITLFYSIGGAITFLAATHCIFFSSSCAEQLSSSIRYYSIIGGLYLPFVTDTVIRRLGAKKRAMGSVIVEIGDTLAVFLVPLFNLFAYQNPRIILFITIVFFVMASVIQRSAERQYTAH